MNERRNIGPRGGSDAADPSIDIPVGGRQHGLISDEKIPPPIILLERIMLTDRRGFCCAVLIAWHGISGGAGGSDEPLVAPRPRFDAELPRTMLQEVEVLPSRQFGIRQEENEAYFRLLWHAQHVAEDSLRKSELAFRRDRIEQFAARTRRRILREYARDDRGREILLKRLAAKVEEFQQDPFSYPLVQDAFNQAKDCQGQVLSFHGYARKSVSYPAGPNNYGIDTIHEIWLFDENAKGHPVVIVCTEVPEGFPQNIPETEPLDGVSVTGYLFKLYAYEGGEGPHAVPLIVSRNVRWSPPVTVRREFPGWAYALIVVVGVCLLYFLLFRGGKLRQRMRNTRDRLASPEDNPFANSPPPSRSNTSS
jgi:hypothetical protein